MLYNETKNINENEDDFTRVVMGQLFDRISHILYTYSNINLLPFINIVDIVNQPEKISLEDFKHVPETPYNKEEEKPYSPINTKETKNKKNYTEKDANYSISNGLFPPSEGGKRKTKKNRKNRRK